MCLLGKTLRKTRKSPRIYVHKRQKETHRSDLIKAKCIRRRSNIVNKYNKKIYTMAVDINIYLSKKYTI